jgi:hypothetical protein
MKVRSPRIHCDRASAIEAKDTSFALEVPIGGTIPVLEQEAPVVIDCLRIHVWRATANNEEAPRLSER